VLRDATDAAAGEALDVRLAAGRLAVTVLDGRDREDGQQHEGTAA
jgi:hypothetical protein